MRKTKIICTIGPACENEETLVAMCQAGMNVARLNFSHGTHEEHLKRIETIRSVREKLKLPIAIMLDTKGPEYRIKTFRNGQVTLQDGGRFTLTTEDVEGDETRVSVTYAKLTEELSPGDTVLINNGLVILQVEEVQGNDVICRIKNGGVLSDRKSMNFPGKVLKQEFLSEQDRSDLLFGIE
ncbi:MAG: pyruvate kinase, partial [Clostridia bacterium]|nr:pyruvate kinase [Clostridia bacterium]